MRRGASSFRWCSDTGFLPVKARWDQFNPSGWFTHRGAAYDLGVSALKLSRKGLSRPKGKFVNAYLKLSSARKGAINFGAAYIRSATSRPGKASAFPGFGIVAPRLAWIKFRSAGNPRRRTPRTIDQGRMPRCPLRAFAPRPAWHQRPRPWALLGLLAVWQHRPARKTRS